MTDTSTIPLRAHVLLKMAAPAVARAALLGDEEEASEALEKGTTTHALTFNTQHVVVYPGAVRRGREWEAFAAEHDGCRIVLRGEYELAARMADAVRRHPLARQLLEAATFEESRFVKMNERLCRGTPDIVGMGYIADLKTGRSADPQRFRYHARDYFYDCTMSWYRRIVGVQHAFIVCVEKTKPYPVTVFQLNERTLSQGDAFMMGAFQRFLECERTGRWPEYADQIVELDVPERSAVSAAYTEAVVAA